MKICGERARQEPVAKQILSRKWGWIGHTLRNPASSTKPVYQDTPALIQHHTPSPDLEPAGEEEERPIAASQQLEAGH